MSLIYFGPPFSGPAFSVNPDRRLRKGTCCTQSDVLTAMFSALRVLFSLYAARLHGSI